jgi:uncharacterized repeat protein (TIGR01451 family)
MKKVLNISFLLLIFCLSGSMGCKSGHDLQDIGLIEIEPDEPEAFLWDEEDQTVAEALEETVYTPIPAATTSFEPSVEEPSLEGTSDLVAMSEAGSYVVSMTYPWPECGVVRVDKTMPREVELNKPFDYYITITNLTNTTLTDVIIAEDIPENFKFKGSNPTAEEVVTKLEWQIESLGPKAVKRYTVSGIATYGDSLKNSTTVFTPVIPIFSDMKVVEPKLKLTKTIPAEALLCDLIPVRLVVTNTGTGVVKNIKIIDTLPDGLRTSDGRNELVFDAGNLMTGQSRQFSAELKATKVGTYVSKAIATSGTNLRTESAETSTIVGLPSLTIRKIGSEHQYIGRPITYEITVENKSDVPAKNTTVEDTIPPGVNSLKATAGAKLSGSKLVWDFGTLEPNTSRTVSISYVPTRAGTFTNGATATAYCTNPVTASAKTIITGISAVLMEVADVEDPVRVSDQATYVIRVTNQGSASATNIRISCVLEDNVQYISSAGATAGTKEGDIVRFLPLSNLAPQAMAAWRVVVTAIRPGDVRFKVSMTTDQLTRPVEETEATHLYE